MQFFGEQKRSPFFLPVGDFDVEITYQHPILYRLYRPYKVLELYSTQDVVLASLPYYFDQRFFVFHALILYKFYSVNYHRKMSKI